MAEELKANQRKEWAKLMYLKENILILPKLLIRPKPDTAAA